MYTAVSNALNGKYCIDMDFKQKTGRKKRYWQKFLLNKRTSKYEGVFACFFLFFILELMRIIKEL